MVLMKQDSKVIPEVLCTRSLLHVPAGSDKATILAPLASQRGVAGLGILANNSLQACRVGCDS